MISIDYGNCESAHEGLGELLATEFGLTPEKSEVVREALTRIAARDPRVCGMAIEPQAVGDPVLQVWYDRDDDLHARRQEWSGRPSAHFFLFKREQTEREERRPGSLAGYHRSDFFNELGWHLDQVAQQSV
jgi:hypothetical protein